MTEPLKIHQFGGMLPAWDDRSLPDNQAVFSQNTYLYSGAAIGWRVPKLLRTLNNSAAKFAYRVPTITKAIAGATLFFKENPVDGDKVTVGEDIYTFRSVISTSYDVLLGSDALHSSQNLFISIVFGSQDPLICGLGTVNNPSTAPNNPFLGYPCSDILSSNSPGANTVYLMKCQPSGTQNLTDISCVVETDNGAAKFKAVIYNNVSQIEIGGTDYVDLPSTLIAEGEEVVSCFTGEIIVSHFTVPTLLEEGTTYWIGFQIDSDIAFRQNTVGTTAVTVLAPYADGPPNPVTGIGVAETINLNQPNFVCWGSMALVNASDPENTIETVTISSVAYPVINLEAPDFGYAYNNIPVGESTSGVRMVWSTSNGTFNPTSFFVGGANETRDASITGSSIWLEFEDPDTTVMRSPVVDDSYQRHYIASPTKAPEYNTYERLALGLPNWKLGVPAPGCAPFVTVSGGGNQTTLGFNTSSSTNADDIAAGSLALIKVLAPGAMSVNDISVFMTAGPQTSEFVGVIYNDNNGVPGTLIAVGIAPTADILLPDAVQSPFQEPVALLANTNYWIGIVLATTSGITVQRSDDANTTGVFADVGGSVPATAPTMTGSQPDWQIWADCTNEAITESRAYVYTWVTEYGEEGPPSPPTLDDGWTNGTWKIELFTPPLDEMGVTRNITKTNLYRTVTGTGGGTTYFFVASFDVNLPQFVDEITDDIVAENAEIPSTNWYPPPDNLQAIIAMPNGMAVGFRGNEIWFCEPYRPHAWPAGYVLTCDFPIVGLGVTAQSVVACTSSSPTVISGTQPAVMTQVKVTFPEPCIARGSVVSTDHGVYYASVNGLILVNQVGTAANVTQGWITREKWAALTPQKYLRAVKMISSYFAYGTTNIDRSVGGNNALDTSQAKRGMCIEMSMVADQESFSIYPQPGGHRIGFSELTAPNNVNIDNMFVDPWSGVVCLIQAGNINYYDYSDPAPQTMNYIWRSKKFQGPFKDNWAAMRVWFDVPPGGPQTPPTDRTTAEPTFTAYPRLPLTDDMLGVVRVIADGKYVMERELRTSTELMRITSGYKASTWQWELEARVSVTNIKAATSVKELAQIS